jgi:hypothetical protein
MVDSCRVAIAGALVSVRLIGVGPLTAQATQPATIRLAKPDAVHAAEWSDIVAVRELRDDRLVVLDGREQVVKLVDMKTGSATMIGAKGNGPGEYRLPLQLIPLPGDSSALYDEANAGRAMVVTPAGRAGGYMPGEPPGGFLRQRAFADAAGRVYREGSGGGSAGFPIMRLDRRTGRIDTVAYRNRRHAGLCWSGQRPAAGEAEARPYARGSSTAPRAFVTFDQWAVAPDGRVAVVCPEPYRVLFLETGGARIEDPPIPYARIPVTDAEKNAWLKSMAQPVAQVMTNVNGSKTIRYSPPAPQARPQEWPEFLPPFVAGPTLNGAARFSPDGMLWIERSVAAKSLPLYDIVDRSGVLAYRVTLPPRSRVVGFGASAIYVAVFDDDDIQRLQRYRIPRPP